MTSDDFSGKIEELFSSDRLVPAVTKANEDRVRKNFWKKLRRFAGRIPFARDAVAAFYCATDPATPLRVRAILFTALAYFILPVDIIPDFIAVLGFSDDAAVLATAIGLIRAHMTQDHYDRAAKVLEQDVLPGA